jgi:hypothetical protein
MPYLQQQVCFSVTHICVSAHTHTHSHTHTHKNIYIYTRTPNQYTLVLMSYCLTQISLKQCLSLQKLPQVLCVYSTSFLHIKYLKPSISFTVFQTNDTDFTHQVGVLNKHFRLHRNKCVRWCVFVFVFGFYTTKHVNIVLGQGLRF